VLDELVVRDLGVIEEVAVLPGPGMTAVTGETGAGKTLIVEAIELLVGGRADPTMVRHGADEAVVEGRFSVPAGTAPDGEEPARAEVGGLAEVVLRRVVPRKGRSRAYVDGRLATVGALAAWGRLLVDLHGQHDHQSLLAPAVQRAAVDRFGGVDLEPLHAAGARTAEIAARLEAFGGDERARAREVDLLRFQVDELDAARLEDPDEDERLSRREDALGDAAAHQEASAAAVAALSTDGGAGESIAVALGALGGRAPFVTFVDRLESVAAEVADVAAEVRAAGEAIDDDPAQLDAVRARRRLLHELKRKYGETVAEVLAYRAEAADRLAALSARDELARALEVELDEARAARREAEGVVGTARRAAAPGLAAATAGHLAELAMAKAVLEIRVGDDPGDDVTILLAADPGSSPLPLAKVASGGELARTMLALRLVLSEAPPTLVFDEVDAGIGGTAAVAVGRALAELGGHHQVLVVTHLPQVAAAADHHVVVSKSTRRGSTRTAVTEVQGQAREVEIARMLSGSPDSTTAREHARELLAAEPKGRLRR
jgi:DNA repair protein RecN (Recombination protein N)